MELWGGWNPQSASVIQRIATLAAHNTASEVVPAVARFWQRLSVIIYKGVVHSCESRIAPTLVDDDFSGVPLPKTAKRRPSTPTLPPTRAALNRERTASAPPPASVVAVLPLKSDPESNQTRSLLDSCCFCGKAHALGVISAAAACFPKALGLRIYPPSAAAASAGIT